MFYDFIYLNSETFRDPPKFGSRPTSESRPTVWETL